jgi:hypothetical protein
MAAFADQINSFVSQTKARLNLATGYVVSDLAARIDERSPVGNPAAWVRPPPPDYKPGAFRGNWQLGVDSVPSGETGRIDPSGETTQAALRAAIPEQAGGHIYYITNNRVYGPRLEDGWSSQAPAGMVGITALEFPQVVRAAAERAKA